MLICQAQILETTWAHPYPFLDNYTKHGCQCLLYFFPIYCLNPDASKLQKHLMIFESPNKITKSSLQNRTKYIITRNMKNQDHKIKRNTIKTLHDIFFLKRENI